MELKLDRTISYGVVLEGGGAKGAYQIGAWKALKEAGILIKGISGVSVGALNGALMCMDQLELAESIWSNISYSTVIDLDEALIKQIKRIVRDFGLDVSPLKDLISELIDEELIKQSDIDFFITTYSVSDKELLTVDLKEVPEGQMADFLLASAYFLAFKNKKLHGKRYLDGGGFDNVPIQVLLDHEFDNIIVIRIYGLGFDSEKILTIPDHVQIHHIAPRNSLGGTLEFDAKRARKNMKLGYFDALRMLYGLEGKHYYFDAPETEAYYFNRMMSELPWLEPYLTDFNELDQKKGYRYYTETLFVKLAKGYRLKEGWNYKGLYLAILEDLAIRIKLNRFHVYTVDELCENISRNINILDS